MSSHRQAAAAIFFNFISGARGANVHDSSLVVFGGGGLSSAVVNHFGSASTFWWTFWLILIHVVLLVLAVLVVFKAVRAVKPYFKEGVIVRGGWSLTPAVMDKGTQCEMVHLAGLTVEGLQE